MKSDKTATAVANPGIGVAIQNVTATGACPDQAVIVELAKAAALNATAISDIAKAASGVSGIVLKDITVNMTPEVQHAVRKK